MQFKQKISMLRKDDKRLDNFRHYEKESYIFKEQNIKKDYIKLINKNLDIKDYINDILSKCIL